MIVLMNFFNYNRRHRNSAQNQNQKNQARLGTISPGFQSLFFPCQTGTRVLFSPIRNGMSANHQPPSIVKWAVGEYININKQKQKGPVSDLLVLQQNRTEEQNHSGIQLPSWDIMTQEEKLIGSRRRDAGYNIEPDTNSVIDFSAPLFLPRYFGLVTHPKAWAFFQMLIHNGSS